MNHNAFLQGYLLEKQAIVQAMSSPIKQIKQQSKVKGINTPYQKLNPKPTKLEGTGPQTPTNDTEGPISMNTNNTYTQGL